MDVGQMEERGVVFSSVSPAILNDYALVFNKQSRKYPAIGFANIVPKDGSIVEGALYELQDKDLLKLDRFEGYPVHYLRDQVKVLSGDQMVRAHVYVGSPGMLREGLVPSRQYLDHLLVGRAFMSDGYLLSLQQVPVLDLQEGTIRRKER